MLLPPPPTSRRLIPRWDACFLMRRLGGSLSAREFIGGINPVTALAASFARGSQLEMAARSGERNNEKRSARERGVQERKSYQINEDKRVPRDERGPEGLVCTEGPRLRPSPARIISCGDRDGWQSGFLSCCPFVSYRTRLRFSRSPASQGAHVFAQCAYHLVIEKGEEKDEKMNTR